MIDFDKMVAEYEAANPGKTLRPVHPGSGTILAVWKETGELVRQPFPYPEVEAHFAAIRKRLGPRSAVG